MPSIYFANASGCANSSACRARGKRKPREITPSQDHVPDVDPFASPMLEWRMAHGHLRRLMTLCERRYRILDGRGNRTFR